MSEEQLLTYYNYLYPYNTLVNWLTYEGTYLLSHRQLSFEYKDIGVERYVKFVDADDMKRRMTDTKRNVPLKVDAGAIWNRTPEKQTNGKTLERQLVFDFDMNDYDDVRTCCQGKKVCNKCWRLLIIATEILETSLKQDFDFHHIMYVFSGGRGLHVWVCDPRARKLADSARKSLVDYLQVVTGNDKAASLLASNTISQLKDINFVKGNNLKDADRQTLKKHYISNHLSTQVERSLQILKPYAMSIYLQQRVFIAEKCHKVIFRILQNRSVKLKDRVQQRWEAIRRKYEKEGVSFQQTNEKMDQLMKIYNEIGRQMYLAMVDEVEQYESCSTDADYPPKDYNSKRIVRLTFIEEELMLSFLYPRMDFNVSTMQNHLLKLPFSIHPSSRKVSIPLFRNQLADFDPSTCVTIDRLLKELEEYRLQGESGIDGLSSQMMAKKTQLRVPIDALNEFVENLPKNDEKH